MVEAYKEYDLMIWSASKMSRILKLLQQLGVFSTPDDFKIMAVLDKYSMSERTDAAVNGAAGGGAAAAAVVSADPLVQQVEVPPGALPGQQIEIPGIAAGQLPMVAVVPAGLVPGDVFLVTHKSAFSEASKKEDVDKDELMLALQMSMGDADADGDDAGSNAMAVDTAEAPRAGTSGSASTSVIQQGRSRRKYIKQLSLIWACKEFSGLYTEKNTLIVDDTLDVCGINPHNFIQCTRYNWQDHATDAELPRLSKYLLKIAEDSSGFPTSHIRWREGYLL